jgi:hypothetical protein
MLVGRAAHGDANRQETVYPYKHRLPRITKTNGKNLGAKKDQQWSLLLVFKK